MLEKYQIGGRKCPRLLPWISSFHPRQHVDLRHLSGAMIAHCRQFYGDLLAMKRDLDRLCLLLLAALLMSLMAATPSLAVVVWSEDFEGLTLGDSQDEGRFAPVGPVAPTDPPTADPDPIPNVWTDVAPTGWTVDRSGVPGYNNPPDNNGVRSGSAGISPIKDSGMILQAKDVVISPTRPGP